MFPETVVFTVCLCVCFLGGGVGGKRKCILRSAYQHTWETKDGRQ